MRHAATKATGICETDRLMLYLDHAATTMVRPETRAAMAPFLDGAFGNPSGIHEVSRRAKNALEEAREMAAALVGAARPDEIVFTGGGTEADNLAVAGAALNGGRRGSVITTAIEHEAVLETARFLDGLGCKIHLAPVDSKGRLDPDDVLDRIDAETAVVSVMAANNEIGTLLPVAAITDSVHRLSDATLVHTDAVQAFISEEITAESTGADMISLAGHKFGGPKGVGLLYVRHGIELEPVIHGGGQELGRRSGTHNVAAIVGMVAAMQATVMDRTERRARVAAIRDCFEGMLLSGIPGLVVNAPRDGRLAQHCHVRVPGVAAETLLIRLDQAGIAAAAGSACHSGAIGVSHVLAALGMDAVAASECVRFSFGWPSTDDDAVTAANEVVRIVEELS